MKKLLSMLLAAALVLSLCACGPAQNANESTGGDVQQAEGFLVGFGRADVTPAGSVAMSGSARISTGVLTWLYADTIAITGTNGVTALLITVDAQNIHQIADSARSQLSSELGVPVENIMISATHTHSAPDQREGGYGERLISGICESAAAALADRAPAQMYTATVQTKNMNFVRNYLMNDGTYAGTNFGDRSSGFKAHETDADPDLQLIKFVREGKTVEGKEAKNIIIANFQGHPHRDYNVAAYYTLLSANVPFFFREALEEELGCHVAYYTGASGNVNMNSLIEEENITIDIKEHGRKLAQYAISAEDSYTPVENSQVYSQELSVTCTVDHSEDHLVGLANEIMNMVSAQGTTAANALAMENGLGHYLHADEILNKASKGKTRDIPIGVVSVGGVAFVSAPYEMYDTTGMNIKQSSPFDMTFVLYLSNGSNGYMATEDCFDHGGYGVYSCQYVRGTAEQLEENYLKILNDLKALY